MSNLVGESSLSTILPRQRWCIYYYEQCYIYVLTSSKGMRVGGESDALGSRVTVGFHCYFVPGGRCERPYHVTGRT